MPKLKLRAPVSSLKRPRAPQPAIRVQVAKPAPAAPKRAIQPRAAAPVVAAKPVPKKVVRVTPPPPKPVVKKAAKSVVAPPAIKPAPAKPVVAKKAPPPPPPVMKPAPVKPVVVKKAPPPPTPSVAPQPKKQIASLPAAQLPTGGGHVMRVDFTGASTRLSPDAKARLRGLAEQITVAGDRLQLKAYAGGTSETPSSARRLSLSRALAVRSFLIESGVRSTRIDVRALGRASDAGPPDRVDVVLLVR